MSRVINVSIERNGEETLSVQTSWGTMKFEGITNGDKMHVDEFMLWYSDFCDGTYGHRVFVSEEDREWLLSRGIYL